MRVPNLQLADLQTETNRTYDTVSEWLRRLTRNPLGSARRGSNPLAVASGAATRRKPRAGNCRAASGLHTSLQYSVASLQLQCPAPTSAFSLQHIVFSAKVLVPGHTALRQRAQWWALCQLGTPCHPCPRPDIMYSSNDLLE